MTIDGAPVAACNQNRESRKNENPDGHRESLPAGTKA
jgi:hypothetical protein